MKSSDPITSLQGVGENVAKKLNKLGIETVEDLINYYPRRYDDFSQITPIAKLKPGQVTVEGQIKRIVTRRTRRRGFTITEALLDDGSGALKAIWFNQPYLSKTLPKDAPVYASGSLEFKYDQYALQNPIVERVSTFTKNTARIVPVYPETEGISSKQIRNLIHQVLPAIKSAPDLLPSDAARTLLTQEPNLRKNASYVRTEPAQERFLRKNEALKQIHFPDSSQKLSQASLYLAFEELFVPIVAGLIIKQEVKAEASPRIEFKEDIAKQYVASLAFRLTDAQRKAAWQILRDIDKNHPMNRLLEGDVGSGKTVVAALAAQMAIANGFQAALMAPTEVLANQHFKTLQTIKPLQGHVRLFTSSVKGSKRTEVTAQLAKGSVGLAVGTHALIEEAVQFKNLGLVIIDEQHRFGVSQRSGLKHKAKQLPHLLAMSATPIPRSLALTVYGDLDISVIDELPHGRQPVTTEVAPENQRPKVYQHINYQIKAGRQVYVICPLIADSDTLGVKSVEAEAERLKQSIFSHRKIGVLHGRMKAAEKDAIMQKFSKGDVDILVSTTVVEVGVDIPNASVILIEGAERFGLASLHQLRGRVGRSQHQSYCYLMTTSDQQSRQRLQLLERYSDGFTLAQKDLELRGPGELYGKKQHGVLDLRLANLADTKFIRAVRQAAETFVATQDLLQYPNLARQVDRLKSMTSLD